MEFSKMMDNSNKNESTLVENYDLNNTCGGSSKNNKNEIKNELFIDENSSIEGNESDSLEQDNNCGLNEIEKNDITPENIKKIDDVIIECEKKPVIELKNLDDECNCNKIVPNVLKSIEIEDTKKTLENKFNDELKVENKQIDYMNISSDKIEILCENNENVSAGDVKSQNLSFVIDFDSNQLKNKKANINLKYNKILERFQNRYRSDSNTQKLSEDNKDNIKMIECLDANDNIKIRKSPSTETLSVETRLTKSNIGKKECNNVEIPKVKLRTRDRSTSRAREISNSNRHSWSPRSSTFEPQQYDHRDTNLDLNSKLKKNVRPTSAKKITESIETKRPTQKCIQNKNLVSSKYMQNIERYDGKKLNKNEFSPRSSAMQLALEKTNYLGMQPPLDDFKPANLIYGSGDEVSEAGTYTLDGDNYTEEQKQLMNIDKKKKLEMNREQGMTQISVGLSPCELYTTVENRRKNVLETSYFERNSDSNKNSYLEKIKSKVKNLSKVSNDSSTSSFDNVSVSDTGTFTSITTSGILAKKPTLDVNPKITRKSSLTTSQIDSSEYISGNNERIKTSDSSYMPYTDYQKASLIYQNDAQILNNIDSNSSPTNRIIKLSDASALKTAQTKSDWIQEWARNARARSVMCTSRPSGTEKTMMSQSYNCEADVNDMTSRFNSNFRGIAKTKADKDNKILELQNQIEKLKANDTEMYEISSESNYNRNFYSSRPPMSPSKIPSPIHSNGRSRTDGKNRQRNISPNNGNDTDIYLRKTATVISNLSNNLSRRNANSLNNEQKNYYSADESSPTSRIHKRNLSLDYKYNVYPDEMANNEFYRKNSINMNKYIQQQMWSPNHIYKPFIQQNDEIIKEKFSSPLRRSTSFSVKSSSKYKNPIASPQYEQKIIQQRTISNQNLNNSNALHKSASSGYVNSIQYYINDQDDLDYYSSDELEQSLETSPTGLNNRVDESPITNTRYNKALLMRIEKSKQKCNNVTEKGAMACPNTPELQRRTSHRSSTRQSVPRDSSLNRLKDDIPNSLSSAKKQILQNSGSTRPQPRYMDISKYKPAQGNAFLKKDESKVTLKTDIKRSSSSNSMALDRGDAVRSSCRSSRSTTTSNNKSAAAKRDSSISKQKEIELAMWRRRAKYDPMKAAAADKKRREENRKTIDAAKEDEMATSS